MNRWALFFTLILLFPACTRDIGEWVPEDETGKEGQPCNEDGECFGGLSCISEVCVDLGSVDGSTDSDAGATDGSSDGSTEGSSPVDSGSADGTTDGSSAVDSGVADGTADGSSAADAGSTDGSGEGSSVSDGGSTDGSSDGSGAVGSDGGVAEGLICDVADECVYLDDTIGETLTWQGCPAGQSGEDCTGSAQIKTHAESVTYCEGLTWGGFDDWVMPNIDELRSLIRGCAITEFGSEACPITHQCSYSVDNNCTLSSCGNQGLSCAELQGPRSDGCYLPADLSGECHLFFSSSMQSASRAHHVRFDYGVVNDDSINITTKVRCVRSRP